MVNCLLDTHVVISVLRNRLQLQFPLLHGLLSSPSFAGFVSVASLWEIAIKSRLGKLDPGVPLERMQSILEDGKLTILRIEVPHVTTLVLPDPPTRDPFDRLLLAQAQVENLQLVTIDRALVDHPLAFRF